jgi:hypothetical protein
LAPNRADLNSKAICKARYQVLCTRTDSNVASGSILLQKSIVIGGLAVSIAYHFGGTRTTPRSVSALGHKRTLGTLIRVSEPSR